METFIIVIIICCALEALGKLRMIVIQEFPRYNPKMMSFDIIVDTILICWAVKLLAV